MAKRTERQIIIDRLVAAKRSVDKAEDLLAQVSAQYYDRGAYQGALIDEIRKGVKMVGETIGAFRTERA